MICLQPKIREPKTGPKVVEVNRLYRKNNGNIEIIASGPLVPERVKSTEVLYNAKKYRVPEAAIRLEFVSGSYSLSSFLERGELSVKTDASNLSSLPRLALTVEQGSRHRSSSWTDGQKPDWTS